MERHVTVLAVLVRLWGALSVVAGISLLLLSAGAAALMGGPGGEAVNFAAGLTATAFGVVGGFALGWGGAHLWAANMLHRLQARGRILTLALAVLNLLVLPFGTALGSYALWALLTHDGRRLFESAHPPAR